MEKHDLLHEFPEYKEKIHDLKMNDAHFKKLFNEYDETTHHVYRIEQGAENTTDEYLNSLRRKRVYLKDELYKLLQ